MAQGLAEKEFFEGFFLLPRWMVNMVNCVFVCVCVWKHKLFCFYPTHLQLILMQWHISNDHWLWSPPAHWQGLKNSHCGRIRRTVSHKYRRFIHGAVNKDVPARFCESWTSKKNKKHLHSSTSWFCRMVKKQVNTYTLIHSRFRLASYQITNPKMKWMMRTPTRMFRSVRCELRLGVSIYRVHPRKANMGFMIVCRCLSISKGVTSGSVLVICGCVLSPSIFRYKAVD